MMGQQRKKEEKGLILCWTHCQSYAHSAGVTESSGERVLGGGGGGGGRSWIIMCLFCLVFCAFVFVNVVVFAVNASTFWAKSKSQLTKCLAHWSADASGTSSHKHTSVFAWLVSAKRISLSLSELIICSLSNTTAFFFFSFFFFFFFFF